MRYIDADAERVKYKRDFDLLWNNPAISPEARDAIKHLHVAIQSALQNAPTADVEPAVHGEWLVGDPYMCSVCEKMADDTTPYCQNCGAKMDGGADE